MSRDVQGAESTLDAKNRGTVAVSVLCVQPVQGDSDFLLLLYADFINGRERSIRDIRSPWTPWTRFSEPHDVEAVFRVRGAAGTLDMVGHARTCR